MMVTCGSLLATGFASVSQLYSGGNEQRAAIVSEAAIPVWPAGLVPGERPGTVGAEFETCLTPNVSLSKCIDLMVRNVTAPTLTPFLVKDATSAMIVAPGGGYAGLAVNREGTDIAAWLNSIGVSAFVLKYRVPERPWLPFGAAPLMDAQRAMGLVRQMAADGKLPKLNASRVGFMGFSAGGHLTGHLNVAWNKRTYDLIDAADAFPCRPDFALMVYPWRSVKEAPVNEPISGASASNVTKETPPTMLVQAEDDPVCPENALFYWLALKQKQAAPSELHLYPTGGHGYGRCTMPGMPRAEVCTWPDRGQLFLQTLGAAPKTVAGWNLPSVPSAQKPNGDVVEAES